MRRIAFLFLFFILSSSLLRAQAKKDSLLTIIINEDIADSTIQEAKYQLALPLLNTNPDSALYLLNEIIKNSKKAYIVTCNAYSCLSEYYGKKSLLDSSLFFARAALRLSKEINYSKGIINGLAFTGYSYKQKVEYDSAILYFNRAILHSKIIRDTSKVIHISNVKSDLMIQLDEVDSALIVLEENKKLAELYEDKILLTDVKSYLVQLYTKINRLNEAIRYSAENLKDCRQNSRIGCEAYNLNMLGLLYRSIGDYDKALYYFDECYKIREKMDNKIGMAGIDYNRGLIYYNQEEFDLGIMSTKIALEKFQELEDDYGQVISYTHIAALYVELNNYQEASKYIDSAKFFEQEIGRGENYSYMLLTEAKVLAGFSKFDLAIDLGIKALEFANASKGTEMIFKSTEALSSFYSSAGDFQKAYDMLITCNKLQDSKINEENERAILRQEYANEYEKQALSDSLKQVEDKLKTELRHQEEIASKNQTRNLLSGAALLVLLLAGGAWRRSQFIKKANKQLAIEKQKAEEGEAFKQSFLANMSHEIRTPMNAILGMTNLTLDTSLNEKQQFYLKAVQKSAENLLVIINDVLDISKLESGGLLLEKIPFDIKEVVDQVKTTLQFKAEEKSLKLIAEIDESLPKYIMGDPTRLGQILMNLSGNAIKFTEQGEVVLKVVANENGRIHFAVKDTGPGIAKKQQAKLFESFQQADRSTTRKYGGTGLGLSISKSFVEMMGGELALASEVGKGAEFSFILNLPTATAKDKEEIKYTNKIDYSKLKGISILLAEDNKYNQIVVVDTILNMVEGAKVEVANNGKEAIEMLEKNNYHLILMDSDMPEMDGRQATEAIRKLNAPKKDIPIIALTASVLASEIDKCIEAGMNDSIPKPFKREEFFATIGKYYSS